LKVNKGVKTAKPLLLIPVENQVREFDAKLLLACVAARHGFSSVIGPRRKVEFRITSFPQSIFVSKDLRSGIGRFFRILHKLGHISVAWDEEAIITQKPEVYYQTRLSSRSIRYVSHLFAWGPKNAELWRQYPHLPTETPINITGNPRGDMLRPDMRSFFEGEAEKLRKTYGNFILINTNFSGVNNFTSIQNYFLPVNKPGEKPEIGRASRGMSLEYAKGLRDYTQAIFEDFKKLIPLLEQAFPDYTLVVRPHPSENPQIYHDIAAKCQRVHVNNEGIVNPWLIAAKVLIHNGCTTGIEAYAMGVPAIAYRATVNDYYDNDLFHLPNLLSHECFDFKQLQETLQKILEGEIGVRNEIELRSEFNNYFTAQDGPLACERIVAIIEEISNKWIEKPQPPLIDRVEGWYRATRRRLLKQLKSYLPRASIPHDLQRHRYPGITHEEVRMRTSRFCKVLKFNEEIKTEMISDQLFKIGA
jgi:surface carbohydrate biosynthesis protein